MYFQVFSSFFSWIEVLRVSVLCASIISDLRKSTREYFVPVAFTVALLCFIQLLSIHCFDCYCGTKESEVHII